MLHPFSRQLGAALIAGLSLSTPAQAQVTTDASRSYDLPAQPLGDALRVVAVAAGHNILAPTDLVEGRQAPPLRGRYRVVDAVALLLAGTGLHARADGNALIIEQDQQRPPEQRPQDGLDDPAANSGDIIVTGSRIRGGAQSSPVITVSRTDMENQGRFDLGSVVRALPQSFGGGQNPGIGINVPAGSGVDVGGGSSLNLRGLGSDATLTLLDGRRLAFTASRQSIDVSMIPFSAIERIEIVPDGASAIYGSDAVAGVANVVLRRRVEGGQFGLRVGGATDGGNFRQQYWGTGGLNWASGNVVLSYEAGTDGAIVGAQRSYSETKPGLTLFPALRRHGGVLAGQQTITDRLSLEVDALFHIRRALTTYPTVPSGDARLGRATTASRSRSWAIAPSLRYAIGDDWRLVLAGDAGAERLNSRQVTCTASACAQSAAGFYRNSTRSLELSGDGPLATLAAGTAKLATGIGYRRIGFERFAVNGTAVNAKHDQSSYYAFGELSVPLIDPNQQVPWVRSLAVSAAARYERYPGIGGVPTPKLGAIWGLSEDLDLKASWGRSFKAPTQYQQYVPRAGVIYPPRSLGGTGFPATAGVLYFQGGNPALDPERATTWSTTLSLHPRALPGVQLDVSYFQVRYVDRIVAPVAFLAQALSNPLYAAQVTRNPTAAEQAALIASFATLFNITGTPYNPANIVAIVDNSNVNAGRQTARGVDILARYRHSFADGESLGLKANASYLESFQQISRAQPVIPLAGRIFSPPHWRGQATVDWSAAPLTLAATVNYVGGVLDARRAVSENIRGMTTLDTTARIAFDDRWAALRGIELDLSVANVFNAKPAAIYAPAVTDTPYDSTNYAPLGRTISVALKGRF